MRDTISSRRARRSARDEVATGGVLAAPGARRHPVVNAAIAVGTDVLEIIVAPRLGAPAPRTKAHGVHHAAAASPVAAGVVLEAFGRFERLVARIVVLDVAPAPRAERRRVRYHPPAVRALGIRFALRVAPFEPPAAARAIAPVPLQLGVTAGAAQLGGRHFAAAHRASASSTMR